jgi:hypothetical protein
MEPCEGRDIAPVAINAAPHVQPRQFEHGSVRWIVVMALTMVACCVRTAKYRQKLMTRVSKAFKDAVTVREESCEKDRKNIANAIMRPLLGSTVSCLVTVCVHSVC